MRAGLGVSPQTELGSPRELAGPTGAEPPPVALRLRRSGELADATGNAPWHPAAPRPTRATASPGLPAPPNPGRPTEARPGSTVLVEDKPTGGDVSMLARTSDLRPPT